MPNEENKKNEVIDYSRFFGRKKEKKVEIPEKRKKFSFGSLVGSFKDFWAGTDKKIKIELIVFLVVVASIIGILIFYLSQSGPGQKTPEELYAPPAEEEFLGP